MRPGSDVDSRVIKALTHPLRVRILAVLEERMASPSDIAVELGAPLANVSYHVRQLLDLKLIRLVKRTPRRGSIEHYYRADGRTQISDAAWEQVPEVVKQAMVGTTLRQIAASVNAAAAAGGLNRPQAQLSHIPLVLDQPGIKAVARELHATVDRMDRIQKASTERLMRNDHADGQRATLAMLFFEDVALPIDSASGP